MTKREIDGILGVNIPARWTNEKSILISTQNGSIELMSRRAAEGLATIVKEYECVRNTTIIFILCIEMAKKFPELFRVIMR